jgi:peptidoglycan/LPS O-acetylase OafA/YrhL
MAVNPNESNNSDQESAAPEVASVSAAVPVEAPAAARAVAPVSVGERAVPGLLVVAFLLLMGFLVAIAVDANKQLPDLAQASSALAAALLGGVINPSPARSRIWVWSSLAVVALGVAVLAGVIVFLYPSHVNAPVALTAAIAALSGLIAKTTPKTHGGSGSAGVAAG